MEQYPIQYQDTQRGTTGLCERTFWCSILFFRIRYACLHVLSLLFPRLILISFLLPYCISFYGQAVRWYIKFSFFITSLQKTAGKLNTPCAKERTNRQEIIFPLKSWLLLLLLTQRRFLMLWGQMVKLVLEYRHTNLFVRTPLTYCTVLPSLDPYYST